MGDISSEPNIELDDVKWVIGTKIKDRLDQLRNSWFGNMRIDKK